MAFLNLLPTKLCFSLTEVFPQIIFSCWFTQTNLMITQQRKKILFFFCYRDSKGEKRPSATTTNGFFGSKENIKNNKTTGAHRNCLVRTSLLLTLVTRKTTKLFCVVSTKFVYINTIEIKSFVFYFSFSFNEAFKRVSEGEKKNLVCFSLFKF